MCVMMTYISRFEIGEISPGTSGVLAELPKYQRLGRTFIEILLSIGTVCFHVYSTFDFS